MLDTLTLTLLITITGLLWVISNRLRSAGDRLGRLDRLDDIRTQVTRMAEAGGDLELRRLEHVLIDIRDGQKRLEERLLALAESARGLAEAEADGGVTPLPAARPSTTSLSERIHNRLLAMGYERILLTTSVEDLALLIEEGGNGDVCVEARMAGAVCKGRVSLREGTIAGVQLKGSHAMFP
jgi:hypothetical protein